MKSVITYFFLLNIVNNVYAQSNDVYYNFLDTTNIFSAYSWIEFFENGRFEIGYDDNELARIEQCGVYTEQDSTLHLYEFQKTFSSAEISPYHGSKADKFNDISIIVLGASGLPISGIYVYISIHSKNETMLDKTLQTDSNGIVAFEIGHDMFLNSIQVRQKQNINYVPFELSFEKVTDTCYNIKIHLEKNPLYDRLYAGKIKQEPSAIINKVDEYKIEYGGMIFEKLTVYNKE